MLSEITASLYTLHGTCEGADCYYSLLPNGLSASFLPVANRVDAVVPSCLTMQRSPQQPRSASAEPPLPVVRIGHIYSSPLVFRGRPLEPLDARAEVALLRATLRDARVGPRLRFRSACATAGAVRGLVTLGVDVLHYTGHGHADFLAFEVCVVAASEAMRVCSASLGLVSRGREGRGDARVLWCPSPVLFCGCGCFVVCVGVVERATNAGSPRSVALPPKHWPIS